MTVSQSHGAIHAAPTGQSFVSWIDTWQLCRVRDPNAWFYWTAVVLRTGM